MKNNLENKIKEIIGRIKYLPLKNAIMVILRYLNLKIRGDLCDFLAIFKDVKLPLKEEKIDEEKQWLARLGIASDDNPYKQVLLYRDPHPDDEINMRGDDKFMCSILPFNCSVLELGCGNGRCGSILKKKKNIKYCGLDISETAVNEVRKKGMEAYVCDLNNLDVILNTIKGRRFDYVISLWVLQLLTIQEVLIPKLFEFTDTQLHSMWNAGHWSSRMRMLFGRFPVYCYSGDANGRLTYPFAYGNYNRNWTFKDFKAYIKELGFKTIPLGVGCKFPIKSVELKKKMFFPSLFSARVLWEIRKD